MYIKKEYRQKSLISEILRKIIAKAKQRIKKTKKTNIKFIIVFPIIIKEGFKSELKGKTKEIAETKKEVYYIILKFY